MSRPGTATIRGAGATRGGACATTGGAGATSGGAGATPGGAVLCLASAAAFGAMGIFGRLAYDEGATVGTLLAVRFALAAALFWALVAARGAATELKKVRRRDLAAGLGLGAGIYAAQAGGYFAALERVDPSLLALLVYTFPAIVAVAAIALGRERAERRRLAAVAIVSGGLVLVLASSGAGSGDPLGAALGLATAVVYSVYILVSEGVARRMSPPLLSALVCTGAAISLTAGSALLGELRPGDLTLTGWTWIACIAMVCTVAALSLFFAGLRRVGPTTAAVLSSVEPVVTVALAYVAFGEVLGPAQLLGGFVVLSGVLVLQAPTRTASQVRQPRSHASATAPPVRAPSSATSRVAPSTIPIRLEPLTRSESA
jgi:drug/metabolite transporter (DMT)-like permease